MTRLGPATAAVIAIGATVLSAVLITPATADPLTNARERAAALVKIVDQLQTQAEVATERYDGAEAKLNLAVAERGQADQALNAIQTTASAAQQTVADRARALYESGGDPTIIASLLTDANPLEALDRYRLAGDVLAYESQT